MLLCDRSACCLQFRFIVDGVWKWADDQPVLRDEEGNYINLLEVHEFVPENLESLSGFDPPPSPPSRCLCPILHALDPLHRKQQLQSRAAPACRQPTAVF